MPPPRSFLRCCRRPRWSRCLASGSQFSLPPQMQWLSTEVDCCHWHIGFHICGVCLHMPPFLRLFTHLVKKIALCSGGQNCLFLMPPSATVWCDHSIVLFLQLLRQGVPDSCTSLFYFFNISDSIFPRKSFFGCHSHWCHPKHKIIFWTTSRQDFPSLFICLLQARLFNIQASLCINNTVGEAAELWRVMHECCRRGREISKVEKGGALLSPIMSKKEQQRFAGVRQPPGHRKVSRSKHEACTYLSQQTETTLEKPGK